MEIESLTIFFMWCTLINVGLFTFWMIFLVAVPDLVYRIQTRFFPLPREKYDVVIYGFLAAYKILIIFFNLVPYLALRIIA